MGLFIDFDFVKAHANFAMVLQAYGIEYRQNGDELRACCPFHDDTNPSLSVNTNLNSMP